MIVTGPVSNPESYPLNSCLLSLSLQVRLQTSLAVNRDKPGIQNCSCLHNKQLKDFGFAFWTGPGHGMTGDILSAGT